MMGVLDALNSNIGQEIIVADSNQKRMDGYSTNGTLSIVIPLIFWINE